MTDSAVVISRDYEFSPAIVWDALVDPVLVSGWLGEAVIDPVEGGRFEIAKRDAAASVLASGLIRVLHSRERLVVDGASGGHVEFVLREIEGGARGTSTRVTVSVRSEVDSRFTSRLRADWRTNLEQLDSLLRGHPVDWLHWERDWGEEWSRHLGGRENSTASGD